MIERKDIEHTFDGHDMRFDTYSQVSSELRFSVDTSIEDDKRNEAKRHNEEVIRQKLYGDIVDELKEIQSLIGRVWPHSTEMAIKSLINKLEWVE